MIPDDYTVVDYDEQVLNKEEIIERIEQLRKFVLSDDNLTGIRTDDEYLLRFLHCTKFNVIAAYKRMQDFHDVVKKNPEWFVSVSPSQRQHQLRTNSRGILQCRDKSGRSVYFCKVGNIDVRSSDLKSELQFDEMWIETVLNDLQTQESGVCIIVDVNGYSWRMLRWLTPGNVKLCNKTLQVYPCKEFVFHVVNTSFFLNTAIRLMWPFISESIKKQIKFHFDDWCSLQKYIHTESLPPEYGGCGSEINFEKLGKWFLDQDERIRKNMEYRQTV